MLVHIATQLVYAALGFGALFTVSATVVWWQRRHRRAHYAYWNGRR